MKKLFAFLGVNDYVEARYMHEGFTSRPTRFTQTAIYEWLHHRGERIDQVVILLTNEAKEKNWLSRLNDDGKQILGLRETWDLLFPGEKEKLKEVTSLTGQTEEEQWTLFETLFQQIEEGDEVHFDITHGFRSFPVMALLIGNYVNTVKNATLAGLYYGNFEILRPAYEVRGKSMSERLATIVDMTPMINLFGWSVATHSYLRTGSALEIYELAREERRELKGNPEAVALEKLAKSMLELSQGIETCRGKMIGGMVDNVKNNLSDAKQHLSGEKMRPFIKLLDKIEEKVNIFPQDQIMNIVQTVKWCIEHGLIQQGYTMLQEGYITSVSLRFDISPDQEVERQKVSKAINGLFKGGYGEKKEVGNDEELQMRERLVSYKELLKPWEPLTDYRNDMNHNGMRLNSQNNPQKLISRLRELLEKSEPFFQAVSEELKERS